MKHEFWHQCWEDNTIGFHQQDVHVLLTEYFPKVLSQLATEREINMLVPLCGKTVDMIYLAQHGRVIGCELSDIACRDFFKENSLSPQVSANGEFKHYQLDNLSLYQGDFFKLDKSHLGELDLIYDRAAMIALPVEMRLQYIEKLKSLLADHGKLLLVTLEYPQEQMDGPPFAISAEMVHQYFQGYKIKELASNDLKDGVFAQRFFNVENLGERLFEICR
jgi:thiopurine S-methyltransferase